MSESDETTNTPDPNEHEIDPPPTEVELEMARRAIELVRREQREVAR